MQISTNIGNNTEIGLKIGTLPNPLQNEREKPTNMKSVSKPILNFDGISMLSRSTDSALPVTDLISTPHTEHRLLHLRCLPLNKIWSPDPKTHASEAFTLLCGLCPQPFWLPALIMNFPLSSSKFQGSQLIWAYIFLQPDVSFLTDTKG